MLIGEELAVKLISRSKIDSKKSYLYTINEVQLMRDLHHKNICRALAICDDGQHIAVIMRKCGAGNLGKVWKERSREEREALWVAMEVVKAVAYMHKKGIVHRDIKPTNIMFRNRIQFDEHTVDDQEERIENMELQLIDFGLCADYKDHSPDSLLNDKSGTVGYLAPELITKKKGEFYDEKVDIFSCGMVLYEMYFKIN